MSSIYDVLIAAFFMYSLVGGLALFTLLDNPEWDKAAWYKKAFALIASGGIGWVIISFILILSPILLAVYLFFKDNE